MAGESDGESRGGRCEMSVQVMSQVWKSSQHGGSALLMLLAIADFSDDDGRAFPAVATLARKCRIKPRNANYLLRQLQDSNELAVRIGEGPKGCNLYKINVKGLQSSAGVQSIAGLQAIAGGAAIHCSKPLQPSAANTSLNHQEPSGPQKTKFPACPHLAIRDLYHHALPELPKAKLMGDDRKRAIANFWKWIFTEAKSDGQPRATTADEALTWTAGYFARARDNDFIMARTPRTASHANWKADLEYLMSSKGRAQVIEKTGDAA